MVFIPASLPSFIIRTSRDSRSRNLYRFGIHVPISIFLRATVISSPTNKYACALCPHALGLVSSTKNPERYFN